MTCEIVVIQDPGGELFRLPYFSCLVGTRLLSQRTSRPKMCAHKRLTGLFKKTLLIDGFV